MLGLDKKWPAHPDWLGPYAFAVTPPLKRKWYVRNAGDIKAVKTSHIEYDVRVRTLARERLYFRAFAWRDPYVRRQPHDFEYTGEDGEDEGSDDQGAGGMPGAYSPPAYYTDTITIPEEPEDRQSYRTEQDYSLPSLPRTSSRLSIYFSYDPSAKERVTTREDLIGAFDTLLRMEEQLHYAVLDLDGAAGQWYRGIGGKIKREFREFSSPEILKAMRNSSPLPSSRVVDVPDAELYTKIKNSYDSARRALRVQWEQVATVAGKLSPSTSKLTPQSASPTFSPS